MEKSAVMTEKAAAVNQRGRWLVSNVSDVRIMWNITARTLFDLTMKDVRFIWGLPQEDSFMKLKELVTSAPVLVLPNDDLLFRLEADGSGIATGAVLSQQQVDDNVWHPVTFLSKALNPVEQNYEIHDTEMLAIIRGLEEWRHYLEGARHPVEIWTDHKNLEYF
jgi:hypothetical protein